MGDGPARGICVVADGQSIGTRCLLTAVSLQGSRDANSPPAPLCCRHDVGPAGFVNGVDDQEFYQLLDKNGVTDDIHLFNEKLREWEDYYNYHRPHGALNGQTPYERLVAKMRAETSPAS